MAIIELRPWSEDDLWVVERFLSDPAMMQHLGGPQSRRDIVDAHERYLKTATVGTGQMFTVVLHPDLEVAGSIGYWDKSWREELVYETGWMVFPEHQGQGLARDAIGMLVARVRREHVHRHLHAFPSIGNEASNALCRSSGFTNLGECDFEYPAGHPLRCNDWQLDLWASPDRPDLSSR